MHIVALSYIRAACIPPAACFGSQIDGPSLLASASVRETSPAAREPPSWAAETDASGIQGGDGVHY